MADPATSSDIERQLLVLRQQLEQAFDDLDRRLEDAETRASVAEARANVAEARASVSENRTTEAERRANEAHRRVDELHALVTGEEPPAVRTEADLVIPPDVVIEIEEDLDAEADGVAADEASAASAEPADDLRGALDRLRSRLDAGET
jgi:beta-galactosidase beta subunit